MLVLKNARVLPELTPGFEGTADVVVEGRNIVEVAAAGKASHAGAQEVDLAGKTLLPGFIDAHVHLDLSGMNTFEENVQPDTYRVVRALKLAQDNLRKGYTGLRDAGDRNDIIIQLAAAERAGLCLAPDIYASGLILTPTEMGNDYFGAMYCECDSTDEFRKAVRRQYQKGADWIKVMATGSVMNPGGEPGAAIITEEELDALVRTADLVNRPVMAHVHGPEAVKMAIRTGVRTVEHSSIMDDECIRMYLATDRSHMIPTYGPSGYWMENPELVPAHYVEKTSKTNQVMRDSYLAAFEAGVKMGFGTDAGVYEGSHGNGAYEMRTLVEHVGMTPLGVLINATKNNAEILGVADEVGTIEAGKKANLVAVEGKPDEDILRVYDVALVVKDGAVVNI